MMYIIQHKGKSKSDKLWFDGLDLASWKSSYPSMRFLKHFKVLCRKKMGLTANMNYFLPADLFINLFSSNIPPQPKKKIKKIQSTILHQNFHKSVWRYFKFIMKKKLDSHHQHVWTLVSFIGQYKAACFVGIVFFSVQILSFILSLSHACCP